MKLDRRDFLKTTAGLTAFSLGLNVFAPPVLKRQILAAPPPSGTRKILCIFMRGGCDTINLAIPHGDPNYSAANRPTLYIAPNESIPLDGTDPAYPIDPSIQSWLHLHPSLAPLMGVYQEGSLAVIHRVGYKNQSQSHFDSQQYYENGTTNPSLEEGTLYRQAFNNLDISHNHFAALGLSSTQPVMLRGTSPLPNVGDVVNFKFTGTTAKNNKFLGRVPDRGILGAYGGPKDYPAKPYRDELYQAGIVLADAINTIQSNGINPTTYVPANGAVYPGNSTLATKAKIAAQLFKQTPVQIICMNVGGFDTHTNQGRLTGAYPNLLYDVSTVIGALALDLKDQWNDIVVYTKTEFGRTSAENGSKGTDHGSSMCTLVAGGSVKGGVYNAASLANWTSDGGVYSTNNGRYLAYRSDFRCLDREILSWQSGNDAITTSQVIPNYASLAAASPAQFTLLNFMKA